MADFTQVNVSSFTKQTASFNGKQYWLALHRSSHFQAEQYGVTKILIRSLMHEMVIRSSGMVHSECLRPVLGHYPNQRRMVWSPMHWATRLSDSYVVAKDQT
jgi:hypothetical protein